VTTLMTGRTAPKVDVDAFKPDIFRDRLVDFDDACCRRGHRAVEH
jgi:hypothetical protein